jgi:epoxyqueuosine reductase
LGNAATTPAVTAALESRRDSASDLVQEHIDWALAQHDNNEVDSKEIADV